MFQSHILLFSLAMSRHILSADASNCLNVYLRNTFHNFDIPLDSQIESFRTTKANFYVQGKSQFRNLSVTQISKFAGVPGILSELNGDQPYFQHSFYYSTKVSVSGTHITSGIMLAKTSFSGQGYFNATMEIKGFHNARVHIQPTVSGYLEIEQIEIGRSFPSTHDTTFYLEYITDSGVFSGKEEHLEYLLSGVGSAIKDKIHSQVQSRFEAYLQQHIPDTKLADICITT